MICPDSHILAEIFGVQLPHDVLSQGIEQDSVRSIELAIRLFQLLDVGVYCRH